MASSAPGQFCSAAAEQRLVTARVEFGEA